MSGPRFVRWDSCRFIPGRLYASPTTGPMQFREQSFVPYDGVHHVSFFDIDRREIRRAVVDSLDAYDAYVLIRPSMPVDAGWRLGWLMRMLLSPHAERRALAVHRIADLGEAAMPALPWLRETAYYDDIGIRDAQQRRTNPRAQARHALERLAAIPAVAARLDALPPVVDPWMRPIAPPETWPRLP